jgi:hypothetical protein
MSVETIEQVRARFAQYCLTQYAIQGNFSGTSAATLVITPTNSPSPSVLSQAQSDSQTGNGWGGWTPQGVPALQSFQQKIFGDTTLSAIAKTQLLTLIPLIQANIGTPTLIQQFWSDLKSESLAWLDAKTIVTVENYASQYFVPLVAITAAPQ